jgi:Tfp pilus assembly pilus retraction ATPase PilT
MDVTPTIQKMLEEGKSDDIYSAIRQAGLEAYWGMQTMNQCLLRYFKGGLITEAEALHSAGNYTEMKQMIRMSQNLGQAPPRAKGK